MGTEQTLECSDHHTALAPEGDEHLAEERRKHMQLNTRPEAAPELTKYRSLGSPQEGTSCLVRRLKGGFLEEMQSKQNPGEVQGPAERGGRGSGSRQMAPRVYRLEGGEETSHTADAECDQRAEVRCRRCMAPLESPYKSGAPTVYHPNWGHEERHTCPRKRDTADHGHYAYITLWAMGSP